MVEKHVLREVARPYVHDRVYRRQKHPYMAPIDLKGPLLGFIQDTLRGSALATVPMFEQRAVVDLLDRLPSLDLGVRMEVFPVLHMATGLCILGERYSLS
jgi:asparagine synthase (glutamine-hydrolysing)